MACTALGELGVAQAANVSKPTIAAVANLEAAIDAVVADVGAQDVCRESNQTTIARSPDYVAGRALIDPQIFLGADRKRNNNATLAQASIAARMKSAMRCVACSPSGNTWANRCQT